MKIYGLLGYPLGHSFSKKFFTEKFENENIKDCVYQNFELDTIAKFPSIFEQNDNVFGLNCTIPYKQQVMQYLDEIDEEAKAVGAVNTIKIIRGQNSIKLKGFNTDIYGFEKALLPLLKPYHTKALILGTGGASKAIKHILNKLKIEHISASIETPLASDEITYEEITADVVKERLLIINATPLGTYPKVENCPNIPYGAISDKHVLFDLVYNPEVTKFMQNGIDQGATVKNGLKMLHGQALKAWEIWNS